MIFEFLIFICKNFYIDLDIIDNLIVRSISIFIVSLFVCNLINSYMIKKINKLKIYNKRRKLIKKKVSNIKDVTSIGGILIILSTILFILIFSDYKNKYIKIVLFIFFVSSLIGIFDDLFKVIKFSTDGLYPYQKIFFQFLITIICIIFLIFVIFESLIKNILNNEYILNLVNLESRITYPIKINIFLESSYISINIFLFFLLLLFFFLLTANSVNLTDGLDGLAIIPVILINSYFCLYSYFIGHIKYSKKIFSTFVPEVSEITVLCSSITGSCISFLLFNSNPAKVFMGDTGSIAMGLEICLVSLIINKEITIFIIGVIFFVESFSVIIQVIFYIFTKNRYRYGQRIFKITPIHHHLEILGWKETKIVFRFCLFNIIIIILNLCK